MTPATIRLLRSAHFWNLLYETSYLTWTMSPHKMNTALRLLLVLSLLLLLSEPSRAYQFERRVRANKSSKVKGSSKGMNRGYGNGSSTKSGSSKSKKGKNGSLKACKVPKRGSVLYEEDVVNLKPGTQEIVVPIVTVLPAQCVEDSITIRDVEYPLDDLVPCQGALTVGIDVANNQRKLRKKRKGKTSKSSPAKPSKSSKSSSPDNFGALFCLRDLVNQANVTVYYDITDGTILEGSVRRQDGSKTFFVATGNAANEVVTIEPDQFDPDFFAQFGHQEPMVTSSPGLRRNLLDAGSSSAIERRLIGCKVMYIAVFFDSTFCDVSGGSREEAIARVESIVVDASQKFEYVMCASVQLAYVNGFCDPQLDPFFTDNQFNRASDSLELFETWWNGNFGGDEQIAADVAEKLAGVNIVQLAAKHLFTGTPLENNIIGISNYDRLCADDKGFGLEYVWRNDNILAQGLLVSHEIGRKYRIYQSRFFCITHSENSL